MTENRTTWKSDNQGVKEETFIQTSRRGRDGTARRRGLVARRGLADPVAPHSHADKPGETKGEQSRLHNPGLQRKEIKPQTSD